MTVFRINETHDAKIRSWVESAQAESADFVLQNLPLGVTRRRGASSLPCVSVAIGDMLLNLRECVAAGLFSKLSQPIQAALSAENLNPLMALSWREWSSLRSRIHSLLRADNAELRDMGKLRSMVLFPQKECECLLPAGIGDYTDFYASIQHARNVGSMFRPDNPLLPNYKHLPVAYHGRSSSIVVSGSKVRRPAGQTSSQDSGPPQHTPTKLFDYECELGFFVGQGNALGEPVSIERSAELLFGVCLLNDWSARDIQKWEYQPLGPFLGKNFCTTISPWIVTMEALEPFRAPAAPRDESDPAPLPYLTSQGEGRSGALDITTQVYLQSAAMREKGLEPVMLSEGRARDLYWTPGQFIAHHTVNGCNLRPGDLLGSGTISGSEKSSRGCLLELTWRGSEPIELPSGERRKFLEDGDEVIMRGFCRKTGFASIGLGECRGLVMPGM